MTNYKLFLRNYKLLKVGDTNYVSEGRFYKVDKLKIVKCNQTFEYDGLMFEKGSIYACYVSSSAFDLFELTGSWVTKGHNGNLLTFDAIKEGIKGWHLREYHKVYFSDINDKSLNEFLYIGGE